MCEIFAPGFLSGSDSGSVCTPEGGSLQIWTPQTVFNAGCYALTNAEAAFTIASTTDNNGAVEVEEERHGFPYKNSTSVRHHL